MKRVVKYILLAVVLLIAYLMFAILYPNAYDVPQFKERKGTQYWTLSTGSRLGYTLIPGKGIKKASPVIFLQGGPGGFITDRNIELLGKLADDGYDVYLYDQLGSGHSERLDDITGYTAERHKRDLEAIVTQIGADKVILIGQSWGAILATLYIADNPSKVEKVVFSGPGPIAPFNNEMLQLPAPDSLDLKEPTFNNRDANLKANNLRTRTASFMATVNGKKLMTDKEADDFQTYLNGKLNKATVADPKNAVPAQGGGGYYVQIMTYNSLSNVKNPRQALNGLPIPTLILRGQYDNQKWGAAKEYLDLFPDHKLVIIKDAGHSVATEHPDIYINEIRSFLK
ncbi:alpha/beta hydrolase [Flavobacterium hauense]